MFVGGFRHSLLGWTFCTVLDGFSWGLVSDNVLCSGSVDDGLLSRHNTQNSVDNGDGIRLRYEASYQPGALPYEMVINRGLGGRKHSF